MGVYGHIGQMTHSFKIIFRARIGKLGRKAVNQSLYGYMKIKCKLENEHVFKINQVRFNQALQ